MEVVEGRKAFDDQAWHDAYRHLSEASHEAPLDAEDAERLAASAYLIGHARDSEEHWTRAHALWVGSGGFERAARCAFWLAFILLNGGELAAGGGWIDRGGRLLDERDLDCVERGYLGYCRALREAFGGDLESASGEFAGAVAIAERFGDRGLIALAQIGRGRCLIRLGEIPKGVALLDEGMVAAGTHEIPPIAVGDAYCTVIEGCRELLDFRRVRTWTAALSRWCESQPQLVLYRGRCLLHRADILHLHGAWPDAIAEIDRALARLADPLEPATLGEAYYLRGEMHRLRGEFDEAAGAYRHANELGREPQPGLALLRLAQGGTDAALAASRRILGEAKDPITRPHVLVPCIDIALAAGDIEGAKAAANELEAIAADRSSPLLEACAAGAMGGVRLAEGDAAAALPLLRRAWRGWQELEVPYEAARIRIRIAETCRALGDHDGAEMELDAARSVLAGLGALPDLARITGASRLATSIPTALTQREIEVLRLLATGATNRSIARDLKITEKTVASHISHIFTKLDVPSRSAATAYFYEHGVT